jgi:hypothetical protein
MSLMCSGAFAVKTRHNRHMIPPRPPSNEKKNVCLSQGILWKEGRVGHVRCLEGIRGVVYRSVVVVVVMVASTKKQR